VDPFRACFPNLRIVVLAKIGKHVIAFNNLVTREFYYFYVFGDLPVPDPGFPASAINIPVLGAM
jgi:hypothetical protein